MCGLSGPQELPGGQCDGNESSASAAGIGLLLHCHCSWGICPHNNGSSATDEDLYLELVYVTILGIICFKNQSNVSIY